MDDPIHASQPVRMRGLDYVGDREDDTSESDTHREPESTFVLTAHNIARAPGKLLQILSSSRRRIRGSDIERPSTFTNNPPQKAPRGFPAVAEFIAQDPDQETYIFRKFNRLTAWNLVVLQNQLTDLDSQLKDAEAAARRDPEAVITLRNWETFSEKAKYDGQSLQAEIAKLSEDVRLKLQEYRKLVIYTKHDIDTEPSSDTALHLASTIAHLPQPGHRILKVFRTGLKGMRAGSLTEAFLDESNEADLVALNGSSETDLFTRFMRWAWPVVLTEVAFSRCSRMLELTYHTGPEIESILRRGTLFQGRHCQICHPGDECPSRSTATCRINSGPLFRDGRRRATRPATNVHRALCSRSGPHNEREQRQHICFYCGICCCTDRVHLWRSRQRS